MGVEYRAAIVVGLPYDKLPKETRDDLIDNETLQSFSPYFDAGRDDCVFGFPLQETDDYQFAVMDYSLEDILKLSAKFKAITGLDAKTYLTPYGW